MLGLDDTNPLDILQNPEKLKMMSEDEANVLVEKLGQNIAIIAQIAKIRFNSSDEEIKEMLSTILTDSNRPQ